MYIHIFINSIICKYAIQPLGCKVLVINYPSIYLSSIQSEKKVVSDSLGLVDFATGLLISILNLPDGQTKFFEGIQITEEL